MIVVVLRASPEEDRRLERYKMDSLGGCADLPVFLSVTASNKDGAEGLAELKLVLECFNEEKERVEPRPARVSEKRTYVYLSLSYRVGIDA